LPEVIRKGEEYIEKVGNNNSFQNIEDKKTILRNKNSTIHN
jgi:hypothetical protein